MHVSTNSWIGVLASGTIYSIIIVFFSAISYYIVSTGFRDFVHIIKSIKNQKNNR